MALIKYTGLSHYRELLKEDLARAGVEVEHALTFARHEVVKVRDEVAEAVKTLVGDEFEVVKGDIAEEKVRDAEKDPQPANVVPGAYVPQVAAPTTEAAPAETSQTTETAPAPEQGTPEQPQNTPVQAEPVQQNPEQPTPSEQPPSEVEGPGASA